MKDSLGASAQGRKLDMATVFETNRRNAALWSIVVLIIALLAIAWWWGAYTPANSPTAQAPQPEFVTPQAQPEATAPQPEPQSTQAQ
jgi:cytoskeletal protein RodZ